MFFQNCGKKFEISNEISAQEFKALQVGICNIENGIGFINSIGRCEISSCNVNFHFDIESNSCILNSQACRLEGGIGEKNWINNQWSTCTLSTCEVGFHLEKNNCLSNTKSCTNTSDQQGYQNWTINSWSECFISQCSLGTHLFENECVSNSKSCAVANGAGEQIWNGTSWDLCKIKTCNQNFHFENNFCTSNEKKCSTANGDGFQTWSGNQWGQCIISQCPTNAHLEDNKCVSNKRLCSFENISGEQLWQNGSWQSCIPNSCPESFHLENGICQNDHSLCVDSSGKKGTKGWAGDHWTDCKFCQAGESAFGGICLDDAVAIRYYFSYFNENWNDEVLSNFIKPNFGAIGVPNRIYASSKDEIIFPITYLGATEVYLSESHIKIDGNHQNCKAEVIYISQQRRDVKIKNCTENGAIKISIAEGTSRSAGGTLSSNFGPSSVVFLSNQPEIYKIITLNDENKYYTAANGEKIKYEIYLPENFANLKSLPVVIWVHGGSWIGGSFDSVSDSAMGKAIAAAGFIVFNTNYRLAKNDSVYPNVTEPRFPFSAGADDIFLFSKLVKSNANILNGNPNNISIGGGSAGAHLVTQLATSQRNEINFNCTVNLSGPVNFESIYKSTHFPLLRWLLGSIFTLDLNNLKLNSPALNTLHLKTKTLGMFHQIEDSAVPINQLLSFNSNVKKNLPLTQLVVNLGDKVNSSKIKGAEVVPNHLYEDPDLALNKSLQVFFMKYCK